MKSKNKMKAEDLRIGNLVEYFLINEWKELPIDGSDIVWAVSDNEVFNQVHRPIKLTPAWLERAGFNYTDDMYEIPDFPFSITMVNNFPTLYCERYGGDVYEKQIQFVHQLQNLYHALTGNELTFNL